MRLQRFAIHGVPRSGTSWLGEILNSSPHVRYYFQPLFSYSFKGFVNERSSALDIDRFFEALSKTNDSFVLQREARSSQSMPLFSKKNITHIGYKEVRYHNILPNLLKKSRDLSLILLLRNPLSVISSWLDAPKEFRSDQGWSRLEEWRYAVRKNKGLPEEYNGYEKWKEASNLFLHLEKDYPDRVQLVYYHELLQDPLGQAEALFDFIKLNLEEQTVCFLTEEKSGSTDAYSTSRVAQTDSKWIKRLEPEIVNAVLADLEGSELGRRFGI